MSDLEQRLTDALTEGAQGAPPAVGLATAARSRARTKRRARVAGVAALVALGVGVPTAVIATRGSNEHADPSRVATDPQTAAPDAPAGYRVESWHSVSIEVPDTWGYGSLSAWCAGGGSLARPRVSRPGDVGELIGCSPENGYGITFQEIDNDDDFQWPTVQQDPDAGWAPGAYVGGRGIGGVLVMVSTPTKEEALDVLATMRPIEGFDSNGCPVAQDGSLASERGEMSVCRYGADGLLEQSELLDGRQLEAAEAALRAAPAATAMDCDAAPAQTVRLASVAEDVRIDLSCGTLTVDREARALTEDVLYWALSPGWSGSVPDGVSLPSELRQE